MPLRSWFLVFFETSASDAKDWFAGGVPDMLQKGLGIARVDEAGNADRMGSIVIGGGGVGAGGGSGGGGGGGDDAGLGLFGFRGLRLRLPAPLFFVC
jgi:hypothetical protein